MSKYLVVIPTDPTPKKTKDGTSWRSDSPIQAFADDLKRAKEIATNYLSLKAVAEVATIYELKKVKVAEVQSYKESGETGFKFNYIQPQGETLDAGRDSTTETKES